MKTNNFRTLRNPLPRFAYFAAPLAGFCLLLTLQSSRAASATWLVNPGEGNLWESTIDWNPQTVPDEPEDTATFGFSNVTNPFLEFIYLDGIVYTQGASAYTTLVAGLDPLLRFYGAGITNNSGVVQTFHMTPDVHDNGGVSIEFYNSATAGALTSFTVPGGSSSTQGFVGFLSFFDSSNAGSGSFLVTGGSFRTYLGGQLQFFNSSSADRGQFTIGGATSSMAHGGVVTLSGSADAAEGTFVINGGNNGALGGVLAFTADSLGSEAQVKVFSTGLFVVSAHNLPGVTIGSLEGDGSVAIGSNNLTIGSNNLSTTYSGVITASSGSLTKIGDGELTLSNANLYTGATTVTAGTLIATNATGSATGSGAVEVTAGTLGGGGIISGAVTVGDGSGTKAFLAPAHGTNQAATLAIQGSLTFKSDSNYSYSLRATAAMAQADQVIAHGVTIESGAHFRLRAQAQGRLHQGTSYVVLSNTAATQTSGTFANLADGAVLTVGRNHLKASYEGGDGNDLTLTVVP